VRLVYLPTAQSSDSAVDGGSVRLADGNLKVRLPEIKDEIGQAIAANFTAGDLNEAATVSCTSPRSRAGRHREKMAHELKNS
jgi:hypothetical protein